MPGTKSIQSTRLDTRPGILLGTTMGGALPMFCVASCHTVHGRGLTEEVELLLELCLELREDRVVIYREDAPQLLGQ